VNHVWVFDLVEAAGEQDLELAVERQATEVCMTQDMSSSSEKEYVEDVVEDGPYLDEVNYFIHDAFQRVLFFQYSLQGTQT
jgi:hypothetical protein